jgi:hypothetical protein
MPTLFTFGCSYTEDFNLNILPTNYEDYKKFRGGNFPNTWPEVLGDKLNYNINNCGKGASGNNQIFHRFCKEVNNIQKNDIVIIEWSYSHRYRWVSMSNNEWMSLGSGQANSIDISENTHEEICFNRSHQLYIDEVYDYMKLIDCLSNSVGFELYYWSGDCNIIYPVPIPKRQNKKFLLTNLIGVDNETPFNEVFKLGGKRIFEETNGEIQDFHFGESAHRIMGELFYDHIKNFKDETPMELFYNHMDNFEDEIPIESIPNDEINDKIKLN